MTRWYRAYCGTASDPKLGEAALVAGCSRSVAIATWHALLESAAETQEGGRFETTARRIAATLGEPIATVDLVLAALAEVGLIRDGVVVAWPTFSSSLRPSPEVWAEIRTRIFSRDDYTCTYCMARGVRLECDHVIPVSKGGGNEDDNLATACFSCNRSKRNNLVEEWIR
jgi:hypothetical protein